MTDADPVAHYLTQRGCREDLVKAGLGGLTARWARIVAEVERGYDVTLADYLNDMDLRDILEGALDVADARERERVQPDVDRTDSHFHSLTVPSDCLYGDDTAEEEGLSPVREWWYFARPAQPSASLMADLLRRGLMRVEDVHQP
ncbi:MAG TPA: hypothetical protein VFG84_04245 [Gemmatimonadaceae bacterium]|nr:hypothetical protein [Gemmatimonadaceae bacterium]